MANGGVCTFGDLYHSGELAGLQRHLCHPECSPAEVFRPATPRDTWKFISEWRWARSSVTAPAITIRHTSVVRSYPVLSVRHDLRIPRGLQPIHRRLWLWGAAYGPYGGRRTGELPTIPTPEPMRVARRRPSRTDRARSPGLQPVHRRLRSYTPGLKRLRHWGQSVYSKNGNTAYTQHATNANGSEATAQTSKGGEAAATSTQYGNTAAGKSSNGDMYASHDGNVYKNTGSGWQTYNNGSWNNVNKPTRSRLIPRQLPTPTTTRARGDGATPVRMPRAAPKATRPASATTRHNTLATAAATVMAVIVAAGDGPAAAAPVDGAAVAITGAAVVAVASIAGAAVSGGRCGAIGGSPAFIRGGGNARL